MFSVWSTCLQSSLLAMARACLCCEHVRMELTAADAHGCAHGLSEQTSFIAALSNGASWPLRTLNLQRKMLFVFAGGEH